MTITHNTIIKRHIGKAAIVTARFSGVNNDYSVISTNRKTGAQRTVVVSGIYAAMEAYDTMVARAK